MNYATELYTDGALPEIQSQLQLAWRLFGEAIYQGGKLMYSVPIT